MGINSTNHRSLITVEKELKQYGEFLFKENNHCYYLFDDGTISHFYDIHYIQDRPDIITKLDSMPCRFNSIKITPLRTSTSDPFKDLQFGGF